MQSSSPPLKSRRTQESHQHSVGEFFEPSTRKEILKDCTWCLRDLIQKAKIAFIPSPLDQDFLKLNASPACPVCRLRWTAISAFLPDFHGAKNISTYVDFVESTVNSFSFRFGSPKKAPIIEVYSSSGGYRISQAPHIHPDPEAPDYLARIKHQIQTCVEEHVRCRPITMPILPTRVLDVSREFEPVLVEPAGDRALYAALSYCWGSANFVKTTTSTLKRHRDGIKWDTLPCAFQNAIDVTRKLGLQYLWIDSLSIIQDSPEDWAHESSRMCEIYANSHITIAATTPPNPSDGFLLQKPLIQIADAGLDGNSQPIFARRKSFHLSWTLYGDDKPPLISRGWAYQERLLPNRVLYFTPAEMILECRTEVWCECSGNSSKDHREGCSSESDILEIVTQWKEEVTAYSRLHLTYEKDRLPALSGLAKRLHSPKLGRYLAGIWEADLPHALFWMTKDNWVSRRPSQYIAPSWSWASVIRELHVSSHEKLSDALWNFNLTWRCENSIIHAQCTPTSSQNSFGAISAGSIKVRAHVLPCSYDMDIIAPKVRYVRIDTRQDLERAKVSKLFLAGFRGFLEEQECRIAYRVLVLVASKRTVGAYERIGQFEWNYHQATRDMTSRFEHLEPEEIVIV